MLSALLGWIPVVGPIIQGITQIFSGYFSTKTAAINAEVEISKTSAQIIHDTNDDIGIRLLRDLALVGPVVWMTLISWDTIIGARWKDGSLIHPWAKDYMFWVGDFPPNVGYIPYIALVFLFGNIGFNIWKNK